MRNDQSFSRQPRPDESGVALHDVTVSLPALGKLLFKGSVIEARKIELPELNAVDGGGGTDQSQRVSQSNSFMNGHTLRLVLRPLSVTRLCEPQ